jgi:TolB-like protein
VGTSDDAIDDLAQAVLDSEPVNWTEAETTPARRLVRHLRVVDAVARARRSGSAGHAAGERRPPPPESWGHLRIIERIGGGAYGDVYRAWDTQLEREVALKLLAPEGPEAEAETRLREGRLLARVRHSNVVTIYGADRIDGRTGLWMELVRGTTLDDLVRSGRAFEPSEVARTGVALARALQAVHSAGLLHRDVKAQNVVRDEDGRHVLMDFGTGRGLDERESDLTGTPLYLAPEILRGQPASVQTDVYSLGVLLFHLLTRSFPVTGAALRDLRQAHERGARTDVHTLRQDVPRRLVRIVQRAIEPSPQARYPTAEALAADLEAAAAPPRRRWPWIAAAAVVALVIGALPWRAPEPLTIAILPVESPQGAVDTVLADGITIDLTTRLSQIAGVSVRAASSSLAYRDRARPRDLAAFGRDLDATHVLEAGLFGESDTISRVQASLVRMTDQRAVWIDTFDAKEANLFAVRERVAQGVAGALGLRFAQDQRTYETEPGLQRLFLRAQALRDRRDTENRTRAAILFEEVGRADPDFVPAVAGLARALLTVEKDRDAEPPLDPRAEPLAISAYAADDTLPEAIAAMGLLCAHRHRWACAREHFEQAIRAAPAMTSTYTDFVIYTLLPLGHVEEALRLLEEARIHDPMSLDVMRVLAHLQVENGFYDLAIETSRKVQAEDPELRFVEPWIGRALYLSGRPEEALAVFPRPGQWGYRAYVLALMGRHDEARALLTANPRVDMRHVLVHAGLGELERAFQALEQAAALDPWRAVTHMRRPEMALLHGDRRYETIRQQLLQPR